MNINFHFGSIKGETLFHSLLCNCHYPPCPWFGSLLTSAAAQIHLPGVTRTQYSNQPGEPRSQRSGCAKEQRLLAESPWYCINCSWLRAKGGVCVYIGSIKGFILPGV